MVLTTKAISNFAKLNESRLHILAVTVVNGITGNPNYSDAGDLLTNLSAASTAFGDAIAIAKIGSPAQIAEKNERKKELIVALKAMCDYVNYVGGTRAILLTSGFELSKDTRTNVVIEPPKNVDVAYGETPGSLNISIKKSKGVRSVIYQHSEEDVTGATTMWKTATCTEGSCTISGLPIGQKVWVRAGVVGPRRQTLYSEPIQKIVV